MLDESSFVGPYTAIDSGIKVVRSEIEPLIVLSDRTICDIEDRIESALIGRGVKVSQGQTRPRSVAIGAGR